MRKAPPPPMKKTAPPPRVPPPRTLETAQNQEQIKPDINILEQQQERPQKLNPPNTSSIIQQAPTNSVISEQNNSPPNIATSKQEEQVTYNQPEPQLNEQNLLSPPASKKKNNAENPISFPKKIVPPSKKDAPLPIRKKAPVPSPIPIKSTISYERQAQNQQADNQKKEQALPQAPPPVIEIQREQPQIQATSNSIQTEHSSLPMTDTPINSSNSITSLVRNIPPPNFKATQPPSRMPQFTSKAEVSGNQVQNQQKQFNISEQTINRSISPPVRPKLSPPKQVKLISNPRGFSTSQITSKHSPPTKPISSQIKAEEKQKSGGKSKLQQKLAQLRKARDAMAQQQDMGDQYQQDIQQEGQQYQEESSIYDKQNMKDQSDAVIERIQKEETVVAKQQNQVKQPAQQVNIQQQAKVQNKPILNQEKVISEPLVQNEKVKEKQPRISLPPPSNKFKTAPPPVIKNKVTVPQKAVPAPVVQPIEKPKQPSEPQKGQVQQINIPQHKAPAVEQKQSQVTPVPKQEKVAPKQIEITINKQPQSSAAVEINKLLQKYNGLKSTYLSNIHQLQQLVGFHRQQQECQIQKINRLLAELAKKNQKIKDICGIQSEKNIQYTPQIEQTQAAV